MKLEGKTILFLGSSVTYGYASNGISFADLMVEKCGITCIKEAVSGTTLADIDNTSYVSRLKKIDATTVHPDLFICQLSTNDASKKRNVNIADVETSLRFIVEYVKTTFNCPIAFYTGTYFESEKYVAMIKLLYNLQNEYDFKILDLYNDEEMLNVDSEKYKVYMQDPVHPTLQGYDEWWTPKFIKFCEQI
jgi:lysophospholipase L1-like esterase